jgi:O-acetyl-ADP-ribose deacetylase (regulator of RNase III)
MRIEVRVGDIVNQPDAQAIVNSANANLRFGSGVAGAIHTAAGPELETYCQPFAPLALGAGIVTPGFRLPNRHVIHVRAASFVNDEHPEMHLASALQAIFRLAQEHRIRTVAVPAIGTGVFKCPPELAAKLLADAVVRMPESLDWLRVCVTSSAVAQVYASALQPH